MSSLPAGTCQINSQAAIKFLTLDQGNVTLITNRTTTPIDLQTAGKRDSVKNKSNNDKSARTQ